ncbi:MAG: MoaD/ThiS family protein [Candidatus Hermodarchaeota archaeon]
MLETGLYETFKPEKRMVVRDLLKELNLEGKFFGILVNGKKATEDTVIRETDEIIILPHIAGGS